MSYQYYCDIPKSFSCKNHKKRGFCNDTTCYACSNGKKQYLEIARINAKLLEYSENLEKSK